MTKIVLIGLLVVLSIALKKSQIGVNDWAINTLGQVRDLHFSKNKIHFISNLGSIGILDKHTGNIQSRSLVAESQKVVNYGDMRLTAATRYNQIVEHFITATGLDKRTTNGFKVDTKSVQWINSFDEKGYFITKSSLHQGQITMREATSDQVFLRIAEGKNTEGGSIIYLLYRDTKQFNYCVENIALGSTNKFCTYSLGQEDIKYFDFYEGHLILGLNQTTHILTHSLQLATSEFKDKVTQLIDGSVVMLTQSYSLKEKTLLNRRPVKSSRKDAQISLLRSVDKISIFRDDLELCSFHHNRNASVFKAWFNFRSEMDYDLIIQYTDLELVSYAISKGHVQEQWKRQESLAYVQDVLFMKYAETDTLDNEYHRQLLMHSYRDLSLAEKLSRVPQNFMMRLTEEILDIKHFIMSSIDYIVLHLSNIDSSSIRKFQMPAEQQIKYGLRKYLIVATKLNTIIAIDTKYHTILWKIDEQSNRQIVKFVQLKRKYDAQVAILVTYSQQKGETYIEQITEKGQVHHLISYKSSEVPFIYKLNEHSIIIKIGAKIQKYNVLQQDDVPEKEFFFYSLEQSELVGWKAVGDSVVKIWNFQTRNDENIIQVASAFRGDQTSIIPLFDNEKVFFKNVDFTNLAVLTSYNKAIQLYIINGRTGKVHFNTFKNYTSLNMPINLVYDENSVLVSYFNHRNKNFQIWTVEQYQERIETSALNMLSDYFKGNTYKPQQSKERTIFEQEVFGSPVYIKHMEVSESKMSLTRRNLFIITGQNQLYTIKRDFVSTRRPRPGAKNFFESEKFPEYTYFLPYQTSDFLSYYLRLATLNKIVFSPTDMESTIFTLCYGRDLFMIRNAPDKTFDMITEDFNHVVLLLILVGATIGIMTFKKIMDSAKQKKAHIE